MTKKKPPAKKGRPKGSRRPGSRPDLKTVHQPAAPGSPASKPLEVVFEAKEDVSLRDTVSQLKKKTFLQAFAVQGTVLHAAQTAQIDRRTVQRWLKEDPEFRAGFKDAREDATDMLEHAGVIRAVLGVSKTVYYKGRPIGTEREFSDTMTIVLLKAHRPEKFRERYELTGAGGGAIEVSNPVQRIMAKLVEMKTRMLGELPGGENK